MSPDNMRAIHALQSAPYLELLDIVDELRATGLRGILSLPQLVVCGDQSSGKSSVLEAVCGIPFPKKDSLCTRFATEVILRRKNDDSIKVSIMPSESRSETDSAHLLDFGRIVDNVEDLPGLIEQAKTAMGLGSLGNAFSTDVLRLEVSGPKLPQLTIVDLPGLIHSENKLQSSSDVTLVSELVESYMTQPRSIILAVISAKNDYANQIVLQRAKRADPGGARTLGIITKPDTLYPGSDGESGFVTLAKNADVKFNLGWHVVRNPDSNIEKINDQNEREELEEKFFQNSTWRTLDESSRGIQALRVRLSKVLFEQIQTELPSLIQEIGNEMRTCEFKLAKLGRSRQSLHEQRMYLLEISQSFQKLVKAGCDGQYEYPLFHQLDSEGIDVCRIRAIIQNESTDFENVIRTKGSIWKIANEGMSSNGTDRAKAVSRVVEVLRKSRGRELPGTFNPLLIGELFRDYASSWSNLAQQHVQAIWQSGKDLVQLLVKELADEDVTEQINREILHESMENIRRSAEKRLNQVLNELFYHPITYNHYFSDTAAKLQNDRLQGDMRAKLKSCFPAESSTMSLTFDDLDWLVERLTVRVNPDMSQAAAENLLDNLLAYYKTARKRLVDDVAVQVVETEIVKPLQDILEPALVFAMSDSRIAKITDESPAKQELRARLESRFRILQSSNATCQQYLRREVHTDVLDGDTDMTFTDSSKVKARDLMEAEEINLDGTGHIGSATSGLSTPSTPIASLGDEVSASQNVEEPSFEDAFSVTGTTNPPTKKRFKRKSKISSSKWDELFDE